MKNLALLFLVLFSAISGYSQVVADPALNTLNFSAVQVDTLIDPKILIFDNVINLKVPILNKNILNRLPAGSCKIKIGLGSKLVLDPSFDLNKTNTSDYFNWTVVNQGGQVQLTGELMKELPENFDKLGEFMIKGSLLGNSTITVNFLVTNHNTAVVLSDQNPSNNNASIAYSILDKQAGPLPVTFLGLKLKNEDCGIKVSFTTANEINLKGYEIEASKDGSNFIRIAEIAANNSLNYNSTFQLNDNIKTSLLYVRIKSIDIDGKTQYSGTRTVKGTCNGKIGIKLYPNPVAKNSSELTLKAEDGLFNGRISIALLDMTGRIILQNEMNLVDVNQLKLRTGLLASGQYLLKITGSEIDTPYLLRFQQL